MINSSDYTVYGIESNTERYSWAGYHTFVVLSSLFGDTLILYATFQKNAVRLNRSLVTVIQNLAISDIALALSSALPTAASLLTNSDLKNTTCYPVVYMIYLMYPVSMLLIAVMTTIKLYLLKYPLRVVKLNRKKILHICIFIWIWCSLTVPITFIVLGGDDLHFDYRIYNCDYRFTEAAWKIIMPIYSIIFQLVPSCVIIGTAMPTMKYLMDVSRSARQVYRLKIKIVSSVQLKFPVRVNVKVGCSFTVCDRLHINGNK